jgi:16S rRNA (guanine527-N7)-methyltransferase
VTVRRSRLDALAAFPALRRIETELEVYETLLRRWQAKINLVALNTLDDVWARHFADSAQALAVAPEARRWIDLGSGAGFPGLVTALLLKEWAGARVDLIESDQRKAAFLRAVSRETGAPAGVHVGRIESILPRLPVPDAISARALAPLPALVEMCRPALEKGVRGVFLKGAEWSEELTATRLPDYLDARTFPSGTYSGARIVVIERRETADTPGIRDEKS